MIFQLLGGILVAAGVFAALLWSVFQGVVARGKLQYAHIATAALTLLGIASISAYSFSTSQILGFLLLASAATAAVLETGWNRALPVLQIIFAVTLILGLPFTSA